MEPICKNTKYKKICNTRFIAINVIFSIFIVQVIVICKLAPLAYAPVARAASGASCVNPFPSNNGASAPPAPATPGIVVINEVLPWPQSQWNCAAPQSYDKSNLTNAWIEIYNPQNHPLDLYAAHASLDQGQGTNLYWIPFGSIIAAHNFLVFFPFIYPSPLSLVRLTISQIVIDQVSIPSLASATSETSYARISDGSNNWQITTTPTIASSNQSTKSSAKTSKTSHSTKTPSHTTKQKSQKTQSGGTPYDEESTDASNTGVQPTWSALLLPSSGPNNTATDNPTQHNSPPSAKPPDSIDLLTKILFTLLIVVFSLALPWGWRLYKRKKSP